jgi:hypothetical protein
MAANYVKRIRNSGLSIYDSLDDRPDLLVDHDSLQAILNSALVGLNLDYPPRTRSKVVKAAVCQALGYPVPERFRKTKPRFPGQQFDTYVQKANNLQIWNEEVAASRRYVLIRVDGRGIVTRVRVVTGELVARLDRTGTLTHKYQARAKSTVTQSVLVTPSDTENVIARLIRSKHPDWPNFLAIREVFKRLTTLIGTVIHDPGTGQERNRGGELHSVVCRALGMRGWHDDGQFPDITEQLIEVKLQTAPTIDLGLVCPNHTENLADSKEIRHCDVRYAVFYGTIIRKKVRLDSFVLATGEGFFDFFNQFGGKVKNSKLQIPLPGDFFDEAK